MGDLLVYGSPISTYLRTVRLTLEEKLVPYRIVDIDMLKGGHKAPDHLMRHPFGRVPAIEHDGFKLYETTAITRYVDETFPGEKLQPADPKARSRMNQVIGIVDAYAYDAIIVGLVMQRFVAPLVGGRTDETVISGAVPQIKTSLESLQKLLEGHKFFTGDTLSLADLHVMPVFWYFTQTPESQQLLADKPGLTKWWAGTSKRTSMAKTQPRLG